MSPRAFQTVLVAPMAPKERKDLESRVLAAAFKQSFQRGDTEGANLAHKQIYLLLKASENEAAMADLDEGADNGAYQESGDTIADSPAEDRAGTREISLGNAEYAKLEVEAMEKLTAKAKAKFTKENVPVKAAASSTASKLPAQPGSAPETRPTDSTSTLNSLPSLPAVNFAETPSSSQVAAAPKPSQEQDTPKNSYLLLNVEPGASFREIHISFLRLARRILVEMNQAPKKKKRNMIKELQQVWIAHDILSDPLTRTDYDIRFLGLKTPVAGTKEGITEGGGVLFKVGELLESAGLLEPTELEIAADMHKAMPEMLFGTFLVKQGFITEGDLDQAVLGQELVKNALITLDVYKQAMSGWLSSQTPIREYLVNENIIAKDAMDSIIAKNLTEIQVQKQVQAQQKNNPMNKIQAISSGPMINTEEAAKRMISKGHAIPGWKDQLDWLQPEMDEEVVKFEQAVRQEKEYARPDIEDIVSDSSKKSGKKSLRSLMDGIHAPELTDEPKSKTRKTIADLMGPLVDDELDKPKSVEEISNLQQLLQPEELQVIEALESIDHIVIEEEAAKITNSMRDTAESLKRPMLPQAEKYSDITADKPMPETSQPLRTWMEDESSLGFGFEEANYDEEEDIEYSFDFGRSNEDDEDLREVQSDPKEELDHFINNGDEVSSSFAPSFVPFSAPDIVAPSETEFPNDQDELWEYVEDSNHKESESVPKESVATIEEVKAEFVEEEPEVEEMLEVEVVVQLEVEEDKDPNGDKTREFEFELAQEDLREQSVGTMSSWAIEPFKAPVIADAQTSDINYDKLETTSERNLEETAAISTEMAKRAVADAEMKARSQTTNVLSKPLVMPVEPEAQEDKPRSRAASTSWISEKEEEPEFSVHFVQADEDSTVEDLEPVVISKGEHRQPDSEDTGETVNPDTVTMQGKETAPGNEETSEWQLVYKISGSLADALMSDDDDDETDMGNLAPKIDDVNVFMTPGQFSGPSISNEWDRKEEHESQSQESFDDDQEEDEDEDEEERES